MNKVSRRSLQVTAVFAAAACGFAACSLRGPGSEQTARSSAAITAVAVGAPCGALEDAVIATTGNVFSNASSLVDSYQSSLGPYGGTNVGTNGTVQAAGTVVRNGGTIHGAATSNSVAGLAVVPVPAGATPLPLGSQAPGSLNINIASDSITLAPGNYVAANLNVNFPGAIRISPPGPVSIFVTGSLNLGGNENVNGVPSNLQFLVTSSGSVNVNSRGTLVGFIYAPTSTVNLNSTIFGSVVGSTVTLNSGSVIHFDQSSVCPAAQPTAAIPPTPLPDPPPPVAGCYVNTANGWQGVPCATTDEVNARFPHPQFLNSVFVTAPQTPLVFAQLETTLPAVASITDTFIDSGIAICPTTGPSTPNIWSVQHNTNPFRAPNGDDCVVQFAIQSDGVTDAVCIWNADVTKQDYPTICYIPPPRQRAGGLQPFDSANIAAYTNAATNTLTLVAQLTWVQPGDPNTFAVVTPDTNGLTGNWFESTGSVLGFGKCSQAHFADAELVTQLMVSSCVGDTQATSPTCPPPTLQPNAVLATLGPKIKDAGGLVNEDGGTAESNNLIQVGPTSFTYLNSDLAVMNYTSTTTGACLGPSQVYVKDSPNDFGSTPSDVGNAVFWESPDIFVVPHGSSVSVTATSAETLITPGGLFDIWVRVHNDLGCSPATGVKALVYIADPSAITAQWDSITNNAYVGDDAGTAGVTVPAGNEALIGPIPFKAPMTGLGDGHRCILAAIEGDTESAVANTFDAPNSYQVAQRNIQFSNCAYPLTNATTSSGTLQLTLTVTPPAVKPVLSGPSPDIEVTFDDADSSWATVWSAQAAQPGNATPFTVTHAAGPGTTTVRLGANSIVLNPVTLPAGQSRTASGVLNLAAGTAAAVLQIQATFTDATGDPPVKNGGSCQGTPAIIVP